MIEHAGLAEALALVGEARGVPLRIAGQGLVVAETSIPGLPPELLPRQGKRRTIAPLDRLESAFPSMPHGDQREKMVYKIIQDGQHGLDPTRLDAELLESLGQRLPLASAEHRAVLADAMRDTFWVRVTETFQLLPLHAILPLNFAHSTSTRKPARYKMFTGEILLYLCWDGAGVDADLVQRFYDVINAADDATLLDELIVATAGTVAGPGAADAARATALMERRGAEIERKLGAGAFCQPGLSRFQADLRTLLSMRESVPRRDLLDELTALLSLHLALHYYRVALVLGEALEDAIAATAGLTPPPVGVCDCAGGLAACSLAGRLRFRVGTSGDRPVRERDGCAQAYRELDSARLLALPAVIITANLAGRLWAALASDEVGGSSSGRLELQALAAAARGDAQLARRIDAAAAGWAVVLAAGASPGSSPGSLARQVAGQPGLFALKRQLLDALRARLRKTSRDVVNQLAQRETGGSMIRRRGRVTFFELDEQFTHLLVKLICRDGQVPFGDFLRQLAGYGLAPDSRAEEELLVQTLERMGMLRRYSDSGEAIYVLLP